MDCYLNKDGNTYLNSVWNKNIDIIDSEVIRGNLIWQINHLLIVVITVQKKSVLILNVIVKEV